MFIVMEMLELYLFVGIIVSIFGLINDHYLIEKLFNLIAIFILVSFWLLLQGFEFLPLIVLIIYVGSIAVLFLFVVIIINPDYSDMRNEFFNLKYLWYRQDLTDLNSKLKVYLLNNKPSTIVTSNFLSTLQNQVTYNLNTQTQFQYFLTLFMSSFLFFIFYFLGFISTFYFFFSVSPDTLCCISGLSTLDNLFTTYIDVYYIATLLYTRFLFEFLLMGFILFVAMVGVIMFGAKKSLFIKRQNISEQFFRNR